MKNLDKNFNMVQDILNKTEEELKKMSPVNVLVIGKTGVGKSTLINNVFRENLALTGIGRPITKHLRRISKEGIPMVLYDTRGLELSLEVQKEIKDEVFDTIKEKKKSGIKEEIHIAYYCINANSSRIEPTELELISELSGKIPVVIVLTQSIGESATLFKEYIENLNLPIYGVVAVMAEDFKVTEDFSVSSFGLKELIELSFEIIPEEVKKAFNNAQQVDIARKANSARSWALRYIGTSFGVGFLPIPFSDASVLVPMQVTLLAHITAIFGISMDKSTIASLVAAIGGTGGATFAGRYIVSNVIKMIPGAGTVVGGFISGSTAAIITTALSMSYIEVLTIIAAGEKDGKYPDLKNIEILMREKFQERLKKGSKIDKKIDITTDLPKENLELDDSKKDYFLSKFKRLIKRKNSKNDS
ncbi:GTPase [Carnobacterium pleistocenium]|uniref:GTPase n=1 Tax=Carnobacterium pleistocenium TaxID=181073 RepID=UPI00054F3DA3|nr:GTPase [Carnobacterium pleistocenium]